MANVWPTANSFPQKPLASMSSESDEQNVAIRTKMDVGPDKTRQRSTAGSELHSYTFLMTATNKVAMKVFFNTTTSHGTTSFEWDHPETTTTEDWRFMTPPVYTYTQKLYMCSVELEMLP